MTEVIRRRKRKEDQPPAPAERAPNEVKRYGCTNCFESFYAVHLKPCPVCGGEAELATTFGPVPGKFTKKNTTGKDAHAVILTLRLSQAVTDRLDAVRGEKKRSTWLREMVERVVEECDAPAT